MNYKRLQRRKAFIALSKISFFNGQDQESWYLLLAAMYPALLLFNIQPFFAKSKAV